MLKLKKGENEIHISDYKRLVNWKPVKGILSASDDPDGLLLNGYLIRFHTACKDKHKLQR